MSIESAPDVRHIPHEHTLRLKTLFTLVSVFLIAYGDTLHAETPAQTTRKKPTARPYPALDALETVIKAETPLLNHQLCNTREEALLHIKIAIREALHHQNPLPDYAKTILSVPYKVDDYVEAHKRMQDARTFLDELEEELPGRIAVSDANTAFNSLLEEQFHCRITADDPVLRSRLQEYKTGTDAEQSGKAFERMCHHLQAIPLPVANGFFLRPIQEGEEFRTNERMGMVTIGGPKIQYREAFMLPDKGMILTLTAAQRNETEEEKMDRKEEEYIALFFQKIPEPTESVFIPTKITGAPFHPWNKDNSQSTPSSTTWIPLMEKTCTAMIGKKPASYDIPTAQPTVISLGLQTLYVQSSEKQADGTWITHMKGTVWEGVEWPKTTNEEDMFSYQLVAGNQVSALTADDETMDAIVYDLHFCKRELEFFLKTAQHPQTVRIRAYTEISKEEITLP